MDLSASDRNELLFVGFNQDSGCFACGTDTGFRIYNVDPFKETFRREFSQGGIGRVEMLFRCNILALVGGGKHPRFPPHKVMIWDDHQNMCIGELAFRSDVKNVKLRRDRVVVVLTNKLYVYNFADLNLLDHIETVENPLGLCALCPDPYHTVLASPGLQQGHVRVELYDIRQQTLIPAHETALAALALNNTGKRLATASEKGTLIRVFDTATGDLLQELRRGADKATIYCIAFSNDCKWLACTSDKGTVHVFKLNEAVYKNAGHSEGEVEAAATAAAAAAASSDSAAAASSSTPTTVQAPVPHSDEAVDASGNARSSLSFMSGLLPKYFSSEWSHAQFKVPEMRALVAFGSKEHTIVVITADGVFYVADFSGGSQAERVAYSQFVKSAS